MKRLAVLLPWFSFFLREKYSIGYVCLALQITIIGWPVASFLAFYTLLKAGTHAKEQTILHMHEPERLTAANLRMRGVA